MKQLFVGYGAVTKSPTQFFFSDDTTDIRITNWVRDNVMSDDNVFGLNEPHSCDVTLREYGSILIRGDEDLKTISIEEVKAIL